MSSTTRRWLGVACYAVAITLATVGFAEALRLAHPGAPFGRCLMGAVLLGVPVWPLFLIVGSELRGRK